MNVFSRAKAAFLTWWDDPAVKASEAWAIAGAKTIAKDAEAAAAPELEALASAKGQAIVNEGVAAVAVAAEAEVPELAPAIAAAAAGAEVAADKAITSEVAQLGQRVASVEAPGK